jgi:ParB-like chromosome segregation protein Spo0J
MAVDVLRVHPRIQAAFGGSTPDQYARLKQDVLEGGIKEPLLVAAPEVPDFGGTVIDGEQRLLIARELGFEVVPVEIRSYESAADVIRAAKSRATRKTYTERQLRAQEAEVRAAIRQAPREWKRKHNLEGVTSDAEAVGRFLGRSGKNVWRRQKVYESPTSTPALQRAVDEGRISLAEAEAILTSVERKHKPGSRAAHDAVKYLLRKRLRPETKKRQERTPRTPKYRPDENQRSDVQVWAEIRRLIQEWGLREAGGRPFAEHDHRSIFINRAIGEFRSDVQCAARDLRREVRRILELGDRPGAARPASGDARAAINRHLETLGLPALRRGETLDVAAVKSTYRRRARETHPDLTGGDPRLTQRFREYQAAYDALMEIAPDSSPRRAA